MTKYCKACQTENRDRAKYCRGCAGRFVAEFPPAPAPAAGAAAGPMSRSAGTAAPPRPRAIVPGPGVRRHTMLRMLIPAFAALSAAMVIASEWRQSEGARPVHARDIGPMTLRSEPTTAAGADDAKGAQQPVESATASPSPAEPFLPATEQVAPESLLALTLEQRASTEKAARDRLARLPRILQLEPSALEEEEQDTSRIDTAAASAAMKPDRAVATRRASIDARPATRPTPSMFGPPIRASLATAGPCDRYNPFGESVCANAPASGRAVPAPHSKPDRALAAR